MPALDWIGKDAVLGHHREVPYRLLEDVPEAGAGDPDAGNLIVEGDNLEALKALLPRYAGRVDCIYIDPPYNTGNEGWAYNDNVNSPQIRRWLGEVVDAEKLSRHDRWLCMMYPRLVLLRELLAETGSIWVSLDDNENHHARVILDDVFGSHNLISEVVWRSRVSPANDAKYFSSDHEYVMVYARNKSLCSLNRLERSAAQLGNYSNPDNDPRGPWNSATYTCNKSADERPNLYYPLINPNTGEEVLPSRSAVWKFSPAAHARNVEAGLIYWGTEGTAKPRLKRFLSEMGGVVPRSVFDYEDAGHSQEANIETAQIVPVVGFDTPKPTRLVQRILQIATRPDALVLDAFAGSGTTAHAVLKQNALDGGHRRFVLVEMEPEVARPVTAERVRRAVEGYTFAGTAKEELLREKVTLTALRSPEKLLARGAKLSEAQAARFDAVTETVKDGYYVVTGERKETKTVAGLGSGFRYATLGPRLVDEDGGLNPAVSRDALADLVFFQATGHPRPEGVGAFLGAAGGVGVYLLGAAGGDGQAAGDDVLTRDVLGALAPHDGPRVVYGAASAVSEDRLAAAGVEFRQLPYALPAS